MPILVVLGIFSIYGVVSFVDSCKADAPPRDKKQSDYIADQMIGKSKRECRRIIRRYR